MRSANVWGRYSRYRERFIGGLCASLGEDGREPVAHPPSKRALRASLTDASSGQATPRHMEWPSYRCFLPDLTEFAGFHCVGPDLQRRTPTDSLAERSLGRGFSPAVADCGYRAPLAPRLARPGSDSKPRGAVKQTASVCRATRRRGGYRRGLRGLSCRGGRDQVSARRAHRESGPRDDRGRRACVGRPRAAAFGCARRELLRGTRLGDAAHAVGGASSDRVRGRGRRSSPHRRSSSRDRSRPTRPVSRRRLGAGREHRRDGAERRRAAPGPRLFAHPRSGGALRLGGDCRRGRRRRERSGCTARDGARPDRGTAAAQRRRLLVHRR